MSENECVYNITQYGQFQTQSFAIKIMADQQKSQTKKQKQTTLTQHFQEHDSQPIQQPPRKRMRFDPDIDAMSNTKETAIDLAETDDEDEDLIHQNRNYKVLVPDSDAESVQETQIEKRIPSKRRKKKKQA